MSKPIPAINRYKADLRELNFLLFEQFRLGEILGRGPYEAWGEDEVRTSLAECYRFVREVVGPLNATGDVNGCRLEGGRVFTPPGFKDAWKQLYAGGWKLIGVSPEFGGAGSPHCVQVLVEEFITGSNTAFSMYGGLAHGAGEVIEIFGTPEQRETYVRRMYDGTWGGTMNLTEPQAGSDVGASTTTAKRNADGSYSIRGTKIFISGGDHDLADNIIHLVLARVEGSPAGTKGLTLFIVPKIRVNADGSLGKPNDVSVGAIEHKMGINGSSTCVLNYGENDGCIGWPVGGDEKINQGMPQMFRMMNGARIGVGVQAIGVASTAYLNALEYAKERKQGASITHWKDATAPRVAIIEHADVRRMLLDMKARVEGIRALAIKLAHHTDQVHVLENEDPEKAAYHQGQVDLLVPLVKAYGSDQGFRVCETAIQTYGGVGYTRDFPVEQYCRDSKIFSIYEGTNHIQAMDLVGRKLGQAGGANLQAYLGDIAKFVAKNKDHEVFGDEVKRVDAAQQALAASAMKLLTWFQSGQMELVPLNANRFLEMISELTVSQLLLEGAIIADEKVKSVSKEHPDYAFYEGKKHAALYFARTVLPGVELKAKLMLDEDRSALDIPDEAFATV
ncbi:acyl-CoA dehydrogenase [Pendulispora brunnea]|uniref:Acyl-CoA dehydrogenase n=1 Tax=Pendulispora brunnea TaxID=2905690 RepID=A0ABZ2KEY6_9BACT